MFNNAVRHEEDDGETGLQHPFFFLVMFIPGFIAWCVLVIQYLLEDARRQRSKK